MAHTSAAVITITDTIFACVLRLVAIIYIALDYEKKTTHEEQPVTTVNSKGWTVNI